MRRIVKMLGFAMVLTALIAVSITGAAFAAGGNHGVDCPVEYEWGCPGPH